jgi:hypothetical protein
MKSIVQKGLLIISTILLVNACATSPTGRSQIILYPDAQLAKWDNKHLQV